MASLASDVIVVVVVVVVRGAPVRLEADNEEQAPTSFWCSNPFGPGAFSLVCLRCCDSLPDLTWPPPAAAADSHLPWASRWSRQEIVVELLLVFVYVPGADLAGALVVVVVVVTVAGNVPG